LGSLIAPIALAQSFPSQPVRLIVPFPPGGSTDVLARLLAQHLSKQWGKQVVVVNAPGGNTIIGATQAARAEPDGHTLFMPIDFTLTMNPVLYERLPYDPIRDFVPISQLTRQPLLIAVHPDLPVKDFGEFVEYAKANPEKINFGTGAIISQVTGELLMDRTDSRMLHIPFKGSMPTLQALLGGSIDVSISDLSPYLPYLESGRLRGLATTGSERAASLPDLPTVAELGYPDFASHSWFGLVAPSNTPDAIVQQIQADVHRALMQPEVKQQLAELGLETIAGSPSEFAEIIAQESALWAPVIRQAGIKLD
ncbi:MAG: Bug family tripartite tricarboxylate transporter substrate binding protein, partial [Pigmentiphaga sp.]